MAAGTASRSSAGSSPRRRRASPPDGLLLLEVGGLRAAMEATFGHLRLRWLPTQDGTNCVCAIAARRLRLAASERS